MRPVRKSNVLASAALAALALLSGCQHTRYGYETFSPGWDLYCVTDGRIVRMSPQACQRLGGVVFSSEIAASNLLKSYASDPSAYIYQSSDEPYVEKVTTKDLCEGVRMGNPDYVKEAKRRKLADSDCGFELGFQPDPPARAARKYTLVRYVATRTNLRTGPGTNEKVVAVLMPGTRLMVSETQGDWHPVRMDNGVEGYVFVDLLVSGDAWSERARRQIDSAGSAPGEPPSGAPSQAQARTAVETAASPVPVETMPPALTLISPGWRPGAGDVLGVSATGALKLVGKVSGSANAFTIDGSLVRLKPGGFFSKDVTVSEGQTVKFVLIYGTDGKEVVYALKIKVL